MILEKYTNFLKKEVILKSGILSNVMLKNVIWKCQPSYDGGADADADSTAADDDVDADDADDDDGYDDDDDDEDDDGNQASRQYQFFVLQRWWPNLSVIFPCHIIVWYGSIHTLIILFTHMNKFIQVWT